MLLEASLGLGLTAVLGLLLMKGSMLALSGNQWTTLQTLTDAYLTKETALAKRTPLEDITSPASPWPDGTLTLPQTSTVVTLGRLPGGTAVTAALIRFRINATTGADTVAALTVWRLHSVLHYRIGEKDYVKNISTLRVQ
ncbi:MAG: hypothetical protein EOP86_01350 [Verrucomicrobiaceae bacterium]|nr:MAG: hypothetical protein EOP86_01350 [Verrucomicrobiaceae bacterium]